MRADGTRICKRWICSCSPRRTLGWRAPAIVLSRKPWSKSSAYTMRSAPCYLNLVKGSGVEYDVSGENHLGLQERDFGPLPARERPRHCARKRQGQNGGAGEGGGIKQRSRWTLRFRGCRSPPSRFTSMRNRGSDTAAIRCATVLDGLPDDTRAIIGGDWNTTTHNSSRAFYAIMGYWLRVFMGMDRSIDSLPSSASHVRKRALRAVGARGFDYRRCNELGELTMSYDVDCDKTRQNLGEWVPGWCFAFIRWALRNHEGRCPMKVDWFAARGLETESPMVIHELREGRKVPLSDHDAIGIDLVLVG